MQSKRQGSGKISISGMRYCVLLWRRIAPCYSKTLASFFNRGQEASRLPAFSTVPFTRLHISPLLDFLLLILFYSILPSTPTADSRLDIFSRNFTHCFPLALHPYPSPSELSAPTTHQTLRASLVPEWQYLIVSQRRISKDHSLNFLMNHERDYS
jgi:hypothetical protein